MEFKQNNLAKPTHWINIALSSMNLMYYPIKLNILLQIHIVSYVDDQTNET